MKISLQMLIGKINKWIHSVDRSTPLEERPKENEQNKPSSIPESQDEIVGTWENDLDDGSGLHAIWGFAYIFNEDGTGKSIMWEKGQVNDEHTFTYCRKRLGPNTIEVKMDEEDDEVEEVEVLEYKITPVDGPYTLKLYKLTDSSYKPDQYNSEGFWNGFGPVFKVKSGI